MRINQTRSELQRLLKILLQAEIAIYTNPVVEEYGKQNTVRITWGGSSRLSGKSFRADFASIDNYHNCIRENNYSAILYDGSIFQLTYIFRDDALCGHRLAYFPCPFDIDEELLLTDALSDVIDLYVNDGKSLIRLRSPLRFDYDAKVSHLPDHPVVHMTFLHNRCRWAVSAPLSPGHFIKFIFRHFYPELWQMHNFIRNWPQVSCYRTISIEEEAQLHVSYR